MNTAKYLLLLVLLASFTLTYGQLKESLSKGTITLSNGEKKEGFIKNESVAELSKEVFFKTLETDKNFEKYSPTDLKSFTTEKGLVFESLTFNVNRNTYELTLFAQMILKGKASLYLTYFESLPLYIINNNGSLHVLQKDILKSGDLQVTSYAYKGILNIATERYTSNNNEISFSEKDFISIVTGYNNSVASESTLLIHKEKPIHYFITYAGMGKAGYGKVIFIQSFYRLYFPSLSRTTSFNVGLTYYNEKFDYKSNGTTDKISSELYSIPITIQQNIGTKKFRPYLFLGISLSQIKAVNQNNQSYLESGFQVDKGLTLTYGGGVEWDIFKGLTSKVEYRNELFTYLLFGLGYNFSK